MALVSLGGPRLAWIDLDWFGLVWIAWDRPDMALLGPGLVGLGLVCRQRN